MRQKTPLAPTQKELATLTLLAKGLSNIEVAEKLHISPRTVESHVWSLFNKTGCKSRFTLVLHFTENGVLPPIGTDSRISRLESQIAELQKEKAETIAQLEDLKNKSSQLISRVLDQLAR